MSTTTQKQPTKKNSILNKLIKVVLPLLLGVLILYFIFKETNFAQIKDIMQEANWGILLFSLLFGLLGNTVRGIRWGLLIKPLGYHPKVSNLIYAIYGNYAVNFAIPRAGELWRCGVIAKEEKIPFPKLFGTMILDRMLDTLMVALISLFAFSLNMQFFISYLESNQGALDSLTGIFTSPFLYISIVSLVAIVFGVFKFFKENVLVKKIIELFSGFWSDLKTIWRMKQKIRLILYSFMIWGSYFLYFYITFYAFDFTKDLGITAGLIAFALSSISMAIPTNGGMGVWHAAIIAALTLYGVGAMSSEAFAFGIFAVQSLWVVICGLFGIAALAIKNRNNK